jgi:phosphatidylinositol 4-kinase A
MVRDIRQQALQKIAAISASASSSSYDRSDFDRLCKACHGSARSREKPNGFQSPSSMTSTGSVASLNRAPLVRMNNRDRGVED